MISHRWYGVVPDELVGELDEMLADAAEYDADAGFSTARPSREAPDGVSTHHLVVTMPPKGSRGSAELDALPDVRIVAYLRLDVDDGVGELQLVVRREFRSLGVATLLFENLRDLPDGWASVPDVEWVLGWSHGSHPAAERLSWRFGAGETRTLFKTLCLLGGRMPFVAPDDLPQPDSEDIGAVPDAAPGHAVAMAPADLDTRGRLGASLRLPTGDRILVGPPAPDRPSTAAPVAFDGVAGKEGQVATLLSAALVDIQDRGGRAAQLYVDAGDDVVLHVSRELGFFHDQTDRLYVMGLSS